ncbi:hypothetical protein GCM10007094_10770 [Pseudovibrio japonicus]|uniref:Glycosyl transferase family 1 domain-containing protein n=1 Tax=Pseudovibrio japonicus TaxID=366534 RepID=A0ABQ3E689_9HYPH|nr:glycosyltransferase family 4 protein [Pseudovibrio japonicus]GHB24566.1 hypothetical protein GCM10007094_10770 [Pseudovibrio japonicus]
MNVVYLTNKLVNGGGEQVLLHLLRGVREAGGQASILFLGTRNAIVPEIRGEMEAAGACVVMPNEVGKAWCMLQAATTVHLYNVNVYVKFLPIFPLISGRQVICHVHGSAESANPWARRLFRARWNPCKEIVFVSEAGRSSWGIARGEVVTNPVILPLRRDGAFGETGNRLRLLSVNRLVSVKRVAAQIDILAALREREGFDATLDIVGEGPEREALEAKAETVGLGTALRFLGQVAHNDVLQLYQNYDAFLATSSAEGLGIGLIEALAAGLPAFAAPIPPFREVAAVGGGVSFVDPDNPATAAQTIAAVMSTSTPSIAEIAELRDTFDADAFVTRILGMYL